MNIYLNSRSYKIGEWDSLELEPYDIVLIPSTVKNNFSNKPMLKFSSIGHATVIDTKFIKDGERRIVVRFLEKMHNTKYSKNMIVDFPHDQIFAHLYDHSTIDNY